MKRRKMLITALGSAAAANIVSTVGSSSNAATSVSSAGNASVRVAEGKVFIETHTLTAIIERGFIVSLKSRASGEEFIARPDSHRFAALQLLYSSAETLAIDDSKFGTITTRQLSARRAEIVFQAWDGDGVIVISADPESGDLIIEPAACSSRPGVRACRWYIAGLNDALTLVAPFFQGVAMRMDDPLLKGSRWEWPMYWEAGFAAFQSREGGFWVRTEDVHYHYKAIKIGSDSDPFAVGFDSEAYGPIDASLSAGDIEWRINVYKGGWRVPAEMYRAWYWRAYNLEKEIERRRKWIHDVSFAISWCPGDAAILDELAKKVPPQKVLLHFPDWREDSYDENYPRYVASGGGKAFIARCRSMGFRIMPHFNSIDMDPSNPVYEHIRDFQMRSLEKKQLLGWSWYRNRGIGVPESNANRTKNRDKKVMVKVHPGLALWRSILGENIQNAVRDLSLETVFIDVTLHSYNLFNCFVDSTSPSEGMKKLISHIGRLENGLVVGGEGLNEITAQGLSFAQAHLFNSWHDSVDGLDRAGKCNLNEILFGKLCRTIGYSGLGGSSPNEELRMRVHIEHGAIPTVTISSARDIANPNPAVKKMLDMAMER